MMGALNSFKTQTAQSPSGIDVQICLGLLLRPMSSLVLAQDMFVVLSP